MKRILILTSLFLVVYSKENKSYQKKKFFIFLTGVILIIISETMLKFINDNFIFNLKIIFIPVLIFVIFYSFLYFLIKKNVGSKT